MLVSLAARSYDLLKGLALRFLYPLAEDRPLHPVSLPGCLVSAADLLPYILGAGGLAGVLFNSRGIWSAISEGFKQWGETNRARINADKEIQLALLRGHVEPEPVQPPDEWRCVALLAPAIKPMEPDDGLRRPRRSFDEGEPGPRSSATLRRAKGG